MSALAIPAILVALLFGGLAVHLAVRLWIANQRIDGLTEDNDALHVEVRDAQEVSLLRGITIRSNEQCIASLKETLVRATDVAVARRIEAAQLRVERDRAIERLSSTHALPTVAGHSIDDENLVTALTEDSPVYDSLANGPALRSVK